MPPVLLVPGPPVEPARPLNALPGASLDASGVFGRDDTIVWSMQRLAEEFRMAHSIATATP